MASANFLIKNPGSYDNPMISFWVEYNRVIEDYVRYKTRTSATVEGLYTALESLQSLCDILKFSKVFKTDDVLYTLQSLMLDIVEVINNSFTEEVSSLEKTRLVKRAKTARVILAKSIFELYYKENKGVIYLLQFDGDDKETRQSLEDIVQVIQKEK